MSIGRHSSIEYTKAVCTCGEQHATLFYLMTARDSYRSFLKRFGYDAASIDRLTGLIGFVDDREAVLADMKICCKNTLRFGVTSPIAVERSIDQSSLEKRQPESHAGPMNRTETLSWF